MVTQPTTAASPKLFAIFALVCFFAFIGLSLYIYIRLIPAFGSADIAMSAEPNSDSAKILRYRQQLLSLQGRMNVFIADSIENRLRSLEKSLAEGTVGADEIRSVEALKNELALLGDYSLGGDSHQLDASQLDHPRLRSTPSSNGETSRDQLFREFVQVKYLFYASIASSSFAAFLFGGFWWQSHVRFRNLYVSRQTIRLLSRNGESPHADR